MRKMLDSIVEQEIRNRRSRTFKGVVVTIGLLSTFGQVAYMCVKYNQPDFTVGHPLPTCDNVNHFCGRGNDVGGREWVWG